MKQNNEGDDCDGHDRDLPQEPGDSHTTVFDDHNADSSGNVNDDSTSDQNPPDAGYAVPHSLVNADSSSHHSPPNNRCSPPRPGVQIDAPPSHSVINSELYAVIQKKPKSKPVPCEPTPSNQYAALCNRVNGDVTANDDNDQYSLPNKNAPVDEPSSNVSPTKDKDYVNLKKKDKVCICTQEREAEGYIGYLFMAKCYIFVYKWI